MRRDGGLDRHGQRLFGQRAVGVLLQVAPQEHAGARRIALAAQARIASSSRAARHPVRSPRAAAVARARRSAPAKWRAAAEGTSGAGKNRRRGWRELRRGRGDAAPDLVCRRGSLTASGSAGERRRRRGRRRGPPSAAAPVPAPRWRWPRIRPAPARRPPDATASARDGGRAPGSAARAVCDPAAPGKAPPSRNSPMAHAPPVTCPSITPRRSGRPTPSPPVPRFAVHSALPSFVARLFPALETSPAAQRIPVARETAVTKRCSAAPLNARDPLARESLDLEQDESAAPVLRDLRQQAVQDPLFLWSPAPRPAPWSRGGARRDRRRVAG